MKTVSIIGLPFSTFVRSVCLYCDEYDIAYQCEMSYQGQAMKLHDALHYQLHPFGKMPILVYQDDIVIETIAIINYLKINLAKSQSTLDKKENVLIERWAYLLVYYFDTILIRQYLLEFTFPNGEDGAIRYDKIQQIESNVRDKLLQLERIKTNNLFFLSKDYSIVDAILTPMLDYLSRLPTADTLFSGLDGLLDYLNNMRLRNSGQIVLKTIVKNQ